MGVTSIMSDDFSVSSCCRRRRQGHWNGVCRDQIFVVVDHALERGRIVDSYAEWRSKSPERNSVSLYAYLCDRAGGCNAANAEALER